jgi:hypothetical protein
VSLLEKEFFETLGSEGKTLVTDLSTGVVMRSNLFYLNSGKAANIAFTTRIQYRLNDSRWLKERLAP